MRRHLVIPRAIQANTWYFLQLEVALSYISFGGNNFVKVCAQLCIDGVKVCDSANGSIYQSGSGFPLNMSRSVCIRACEHDQRGRRAG